MVSKVTAILCAYVGGFATLAAVFQATTLPLLAAIATLLSLTLVPLLYFLNTWDERTRISRNLHGELKDTLDTLEWRTKKGAKEGVTVEANGDIYRYADKFLNHDVYDSLVSSGRINFLRYELQQQVQNIFKLIRKHDEYVHFIIDIKNQARKATSFVPYYKMLDKYEDDLLEQIPDVVEKLEAEFPRIAQS